MTYIPLFLMFRKYQTPSQRPAGAKNVLMEMFVHVAQRTYHVVNIVNVKQTAKIPWVRCSDRSFLLFLRVSLYILKHYDLVYHYQKSNKVDIDIHTKLNWAPGVIGKELVPFQEDPSSRLQAGKFHHIIIIIRHNDKHHIIITKIASTEHYWSTITCSKLTIKTLERRHC